MGTEVAERQDTLPQTSRNTAVTPLDMLDRAIERGVDAETLQKLMDLKERHEASEARKGFHEAMTAFKAEPLRVSKGQHVRFQTSKGITEYDHPRLADVVDAVVQAMSKHGLSHRWETNQDGGIITVSCIITHALGHSERTTLMSAPDESGGKNSIQAVGSAVTYLQRYTLMAATGMAAHDMDDDARSTTVETITPDQVEELETLLKETKSQRPAFLKLCRVEDLADLPVSKFEGAKERLEKKKREKSDG